MRFVTVLKSGLVALTVTTAASAATALPPLETNPRVIHELVSGEVGYQIQKFCPTISARRMRAIGKLQKLFNYARSLGYSEDEVYGINKNEAARAKRDALVDAYLADNGVTKGDSESYCRLGHEEIQKNTLTGWLLRAN